MFLFASVATFGVFYTIFIVPETKGKNLDILEPTENRQEMTQRPITDTIAVISTTETTAQDKFPVKKLKPETPQQITGLSYKQFIS